MVSGFLRLEYNSRASRKVRIQEKAREILIKECDLKYPDLMCVSTSNFRLYKVFVK